MSTYTNQTVSSSVSVLGCNTLAVQNVTVASNGNLSLSAPAQITINGPFEAQLQISVAYFCSIGLYFLV